MFFCRLCFVVGSFSLGLFNSRLASDCEPVGNDQVPRAGTYDGNVLLGCLFGQGLLLLLLFGHGAFLLGKTCRAENKNRPYKMHRMRTMQQNLPHVHRCDGVCKEKSTCGKYPVCRLLPLRRCLSDKNAFVFHKVFAMGAQADLMMLRRHNHNGIKDRKSVV